MLVSMNWLHVNIEGVRHVSNVKLNLISAECLTMKATMVVFIMVLGSFAREV